MRLTYCWTYRRCKVFTEFCLYLFPFTLSGVEVTVLHELAISDKTSITISMAEIDAAILPTRREFFKARVLSLQKIAHKGLEGFARITILRN